MVFLLVIIPISIINFVIITITIIVFVIMVTLRNNK